jgi:hypothetical protein
MHATTIARIRPVSWKICVPGQDCANHVRRLLGESGMECTDPIREPELQKVSMFSFVATPKSRTPLTAPELQAIFEQDANIEVNFDS